MAQHLVYHGRLTSAGKKGKLWYYNPLITVITLKLSKSQCQCSWLYRRKPSVGHEPFTPYTSNPLFSSKPQDPLTLPNQLRWDPFDLPTESSKRDFVDGMVLIAAAGSPAMRNGLNIFIYTFNAEMTTKAFYNSDGDFLIGKGGV